MRTDYTVNLILTDDRSDIRSAKILFLQKCNFCTPVTLSVRIKLTAYYFYTTAIFRRGKPWGLPLLLHEGKSTKNAKGQKVEQILNLF